MINAFPEQFKSVSTSEILSYEFRGKTYRFETNFLPEMYSVMFESSLKVSKLSLMMNLKLPYQENLLRHLVQIGYALDCLSICQTLLLSLFANFSI